ncbi:MAG: radical SAM protein [Treponema sp.]|nr:radical SAM protein [Treponema sp.]
MPDSLVYSKLLVPLRALYGYIARNKKQELLHFDVHIAEQCNLNCVGCLHFSTLAPKQFIDLEKYENDCKRIAELSSGGCMDYIELLGGEPLLNPQIVEIMKISRSYFPQCTIRIATNGTLLKNQTDEFWESCHTNNISITVSVYPVNIDYDFIFDKVNRHDVRIDFRADIEIMPKVLQNRSLSRVLKWLRLPMNIDGRQNLLKNNALCPLSNCFQLVEGKLYKCARTAYVKFFNNYFNAEFEVTENDYIDIYKAKNMDEILDKLRRPIPFCRYCKTDIPQYVKWRTTKKEISEWVE